MPTDDAKSVTQWIKDLVTGNRDEAFRRLWEWYFARLVRLADERLRSAARGPADGEDIALSAVQSYEAIATSLDCGLRTAERKLEVIRKHWLSEETP